MNFTHKMVSIAALCAVTLGMAAPALAQDTSAGLGASVQTTAAGTKVGANLEVRITNAKSHADQEIDRRIAALNESNTKVQAMKKMSDTQKASIAASITDEISSLTTLKTKIDADTDITTLKADIKSIANSYRIFLLIIPQSRILVTVDKFNAAGTSLTEISGKLQARIDEAQTGGADVTAMNASLADLSAKVTDATSQANTASSEIALLKPDNGDQATKTANTNALKDARAKLKVARADIEAARKDAHSIVAALHSMKASASAGASASATGQTQ